MKTQVVCCTFSIIAAAALARFQMVGFDGDVCAAGAAALGTAETDTAAGSPAPVNLHGALLVTAGAAIAVGAAVETGAAGKVITKAAGIANGYAMDEALADGDIIRIKI